MMKETERPRSSFELDTQGSRGGILRREGFSKSMFASWSVSCCYRHTLPEQNSRDPGLPKRADQNMQKNGKGRIILRTKFPTLGPTLKSNMADRACQEKTMKEHRVWVQIDPENKDFHPYSKIHSKSLLEGLLFCYNSNLTRRITQSFQHCLPWTCTCKRRHDLNHCTCTPVTLLLVVSCLYQMTLVFTQIFIHHCGPSIRECV